jgi:uncharacterized protein (DUF1697 family)
MTQFMACFHAIYVGGHPAKLNHPRGLGDSLGYANVETCIARKYK